eukprot:2826799-Amphidinium_carterae.1
MNESFILLLSFCFRATAVTDSVLFLNYYLGDCCGALGATGVLLACHQFPSGTPGYTCPTYASSGSDPRVHVQHTQNTGIA